MIIKNIMLKIILIIKKKFDIFTFLNLNYIKKFIN